MTKPAVQANYAFASDNTAGICPEALAAIVAANAGNVPSYGDDKVTARAKKLFNDIFETRCEVFFVFNGTAANVLALAAICQRHHAIACHAMSHIDNDECGAPEFFTGGSKILVVDAPQAKLTPAALQPLLSRGHGIHFPKLRALSLTQATELGTVYTPAELAALSSWAHENNLAVHMDGARFANAVAAGHAPAELTWKSGIDVLSFGGTKNGLLTTEAIVFFQRELAREFDYRVKQSGQLASKMRFASAQWDAALRSGAWLRQAAQANRQATRLAASLKKLGLELVAPVQANGVFVEMPPALVRALEWRGWHFYKFIGEHGYRLMCSWDTQDIEVAAFLADVKASLAGPRRPAR